MGVRTDIVFENESLFEFARLTFNGNDLGGLVRNARRCSSDVTNMATVTSSVTKWGITKRGIGLLRLPSHLGKMKTTFKKVYRDILESLTLSDVT